MKWSSQQLGAIDAFRKWYSDPYRSPYFVLSGHAGSGKTTLAKHLAEGCGSVAYCAPTGKAAHVLRSKDCKGASTIHSLIYSVKVMSRTRLKELQEELENLQETSATMVKRQELAMEVEEELKRVNQLAFEIRPGAEVSMADLIVVDEASMVDERMAHDLLAFGVPVLALGDPAQLPPVRGRGYFTRNAPDYLLTEVHRQARDNPIIHMATLVREGKPLTLGQYGSSSVVTVEEFKALRDKLPQSCQVIVGTHRMRNKANRMRRACLGFSDPLPQEGERLVCKRNNHEMGLMNGAIWHVNHRGIVEDGTIDLLVSEEEGDGLVHADVLTGPFFGEDVPRWENKAQIFDWGYAITCHSAQGSQFDEVVVVDEAHVFKKDAKRWLYTAMTRAVERVTVVR